MRGLTRVLAFLLVVLFVVAVVFNLLVVNLLQIVTDRETVREALTALEDRLVAEAPALVFSAVSEQAQSRGLPADLVDSPEFETAVRELIPPAYIDEQVDLAINSLFDLLEGKTNTAELTINTRPLLERFRGDAGRRAIALVLESLPPCTNDAPPAEEAVVPSCRPEDIPLDVLTARIHEEAVQAVEKSPFVTEQQGELNVSLMGNEENGRFSPEQLNRIRRFIQFGQRRAWLFWLVPAACLILILILVIRSLNSLGYWWGTPLLLAGIIGILVGFGVGIVVPRLFATAVPPAPPDTITPATLIRQILPSLLTPWQTRIFIQSGIMLLFGLLLLAVALLTSDKPEPTL